MKDFELVQGMQMLGMAYGKEFTQQECELYYEFLREYNIETFKKAVKNIIRTSKFLPKINELIEECDRCKEQVKYEVLEFMNDKGYFKAPIEYEKASLFMERGNVPEWLQKDINEYYKMMKQETLEHKETVLIG
jgi:hypothetical protein